jgi:hypothetical protein
MRKAPLPSLRVLPEPTTPAQIRDRIDELKSQLRGSGLDSAIKTEITRLTTKLNFAGGAFSAGCSTGA